MLGALSARFGAGCVGVRTDGTASEAADAVAGASGGESGKTPGSEAAFVVGSDAGGL